jgi:hypothetical protein
MNKRGFLVFMAAILVTAALMGCAGSEEEKVYATEPTGKYEITYLLTEFERISNRNAEGHHTVDALGQTSVAGYFYTYEDPAQTIDDMNPFPAQDPRCTDCNAEIVAAYPEAQCCTEEQVAAGISVCPTTSSFLIKPASCDVTTGIKEVPEASRWRADSTRSFFMTGVTAGEGVGFGIYFSDDEDMASEGGKFPRALGETGAEGITFWAKGNADIEVSLNMPECAPLTDGGLCDEDAGEKCYDFHKVAFKLDGTWREYWARWSEFKQVGWGIQAALDPNRFINIQFKVVAPASGGQSFDVWLDHLGFYGGDPWAHTTYFFDGTEAPVDTVPEDSDTVDTATDDTDTADSESDSDTASDSASDSDSDSSSDSDTDTADSESDSESDSDSDSQ